MSLNMKAAEIVNYIKNTKEFAAFKQAKAAVDSDRRFKTSVDEFLRKQTELYTANKSQSEIESEITDLNKRMRDLSQIPEIDRLMKAAKDFNEMMADFYKTIDKLIDSGL